MTVEVKSEGAQMPELAEEEALKANIEVPIKEKDGEAGPNSTMVEKHADEKPDSSTGEELKKSEADEKPDSSTVDDLKKSEADEKPGSSTEKDLKKSEADEKPDSSTVDDLKKSEADEKPDSSTVEHLKKSEAGEKPDLSTVEDLKKSEAGEKPDLATVEDLKKLEEQSSDLEEKQHEPSDAVKEEGNTLHDLREAERKALMELRAKVEEAIVEKKLYKAQDEDDNKTQEMDRDVSLWGVPLSPSKGSDATDVVLLKFLRARDFKPKESFEMLQSCLQWRKDEKVDSIAGEAELGADFAEACYMDGHDREGHPVCYNVPAVFQDEEVCKKAFGSEEGRRRFLRWRVQVMEKGIERLDLRPGGVSYILQVTDLKNSVGPSKKDVRDTLKQAVQILQDNYPEFVARNIFINVPFWYYAFYALLSPFFTQRTKSKFEFARPSQATETLLKHIPAETVPVGFGGFKRENDAEFSVEDAVSELMVKSSSTETIVIPVPVVGTTLVWDLSVVGWDVSCKEEFVPDDEGSYTVVIQKGKKMAPQDETIRNSFTNANEPGKIVLTIENKTFKKKKVLYRYKAKSSSEVI